MRDWLDKNYQVLSLVLALLDLLLLIKIAFAH